MVRCWCAVTPVYGAVAAVVEQARCAREGRDRRLRRARAEISDSATTRGGTTAKVTRGCGERVGYLDGRCAVGQCGGGRSGVGAPASANKICFNCKAILQTARKDGRRFLVLVEALGALEQYAEECGK
ncbi:hypothetical protein FGB62_120g112 [Gracilaria domingensis]|nr:hypothetical protein FGB62_120g112 [Gracilaria domingensis]